MSLLKIVLICVIVPSLVFTWPSEDKVSNLFGEIYSKDIYSGYLDTTDSNRKLHYTFVASQNDPLKDPVVLWLNGGPGCSSLLGLFMENGPVVMDDYDPKFRINDFSWNKEANIFYLESPAGVGFSYTNKGESDLVSGDEKSGNDNQNAVVHFFKKFSELKNNPFYIAGESYAGVYVPYLANLILQNHKEIKLQGILVGNGLTDVTVDVEEALVQFAYEHALYSQETYDKYQETCKIQEKLNDFNPKNVTKACNAVRKEIQNSLQGLNIYDIYRECPADSNSTITYQQATLNSIKKIHAQQKLAYLNYETILEGDTEPAVPLWPNGCKEDNNLKNFLNLNTTKKNLHVDNKLNWESCNGYINEHYKISDASLSIYQDYLIKSGLRIWFYSGDTDAAVPFNGSIKWIPKLGMKITEEYRPWIVNSQIAGFVQSYGNFNYITIKGTGHMAPQWKREEAYIMFNAFIANSSLPR